MEVRALTSFWRELLPWWIVISVLLWSWLFIVVEHALNSESTYLELSKLTHFSCSVTENSEFPISRVSQLWVGWTSLLKRAPAHPTWKTHNNRPDMTRGNHTTFLSRILVLPFFVLCIIHTLSSGSFELTVLLSRSLFLWGLLLCFWGSHDCMRDLQITNVPSNTHTLCLLALSV